MPTAAKKTSTRKTSRRRAPAETESAAVATTVDAVVATVDEAASGNLTWSGCLDLEHAAALAAGMRQAIQASDTITLTLRDVESADLSFVQILLAASHSAQRSGKTLRVVDETDSIEALCQEVGFGPTYQRLIAAEASR